MESLSEVERWEADQIVSFTVSEQTVQSPIKADPDIPDEDRFFEHENGDILWMYYNPDSSAGGQFVFNQLSAGDIVAAAEEHPNATFFFEELQENCRQSLADVNTPAFVDALQQFDTPAFLTIPLPVALTRKMRGTACWQRRTSFLYYRRERTNRPGQNRRSKYIITPCPTLISPWRTWRTAAIWMAICSPYPKCGR